MALNDEVRYEHEVHTQQKFTIVATLADLDLATPSVGQPCMIGGTLCGVILAIEGDKATVDVGRSVYRQLVTAASAMAEGALVYYKGSATGEPFLADTGTVIAGIAVLAEEASVFPTGTGTVEIGVLFNA
jgi:hypothetical protein